MVCTPEESNGVGGEVLVKETDEGKFFNVQGDGGGFITQAPHVAITWGNIAIDIGVDVGEGGPTTYVSNIPQHS